MNRWLVYIWSKFGCIVVFKDNILMWQRVQNLHLIEILTKSLTWYLLGDLLQIQCWKQLPSWFWMRVFLTDCMPLRSFWELFFIFFYVGELCSAWVGVSELAIVLAVILVWSWLNPIILTTTNSIIYKSLNTLITFRTRWLRLHHWDFLSGFFGGRLPANKLILAFKNLIFNEILTDFELSELLRGLLMLFKRAGSDLLLCGVLGLNGSIGVEEF